MPAIALALLSVPLAEQGCRPSTRGPAEDQMASNVERFDSEGAWELTVRGVWVKRGP